MNKIVKVVLIFLALAFLASAVVTDEMASEFTGKLIVFHAGSLAVPFKQICEEFNSQYPKVKIFREAAGSRICARKISELHRPCDIIASADYTVIDALLIPKHAEWNIKFASNEMVIALQESSHRAGEIDKNNWYDILPEKDVAFGRSDPNSDPCGYRSVLTLKLAEKFYNKPGLVSKMVVKDRRYIRPKEVDLLALLETGEIDYIFIYRSVAEQHKLKYIALPDEINLRNSKFTDFYKSVSVRITGKKPGTFITKTGAPIVYGVTIPKNAPNRKLAEAFLAFLLEADNGGAVLEENGQTFVVPSPMESYGRIPNNLRHFAEPIEKDKNE
ncbi:MAG: tungstate ABC transporter substrate-binding protein WtpA [Planctomycetota bacterium]